MPKTKTHSKPISPVAKKASKKISQSDSDSDNQSPVPKKVMHQKAQKYIKPASPVAKKTSKKISQSDSESCSPSPVPKKTSKKISQSDSESEQSNDSDEELTFGDVISNLQQEKSKNAFPEIDYVDYNLIKNVKYKTTNGEPYVKVQCFYNGNKWICPNPLNEILCANVNDWYNSTHIVKFREIIMSMKAFNIVMNTMTLKNSEPIILSEL